MTRKGLATAKSIELALRVWYDPRSKHIKLAGEGLTASTVSNDAAKTWGE